MSTASAVRPSTPTPLRERALAPDLARGMMLLLIALAHVPWFLLGRELGPSPMHADDGSLVDRVAQVLNIVVVDARVHTIEGFNADVLAARQVFARALKDLAGARGLGLCAGGRGGA